MILLAILFELFRLTSTLGLPLDKESGVGERVTSREGAYLSYLSP